MKDETEDPIEVFHKKPLMLKRRILAMADKYQTEVLAVENAVLKSMSENKKRQHSIVFVAGDVAVLECHIDPPFPESPFTAAIKQTGVWVRLGIYYATADGALLSGLGYKYYGINSGSDFGFFASKMLKV